MNVGANRRRVNACIHQAIFLGKKVAQIKVRLEQYYENVTASISMIKKWCTELRCGPPSKNWEWERYPLDGCRVCLQFGCINCHLLLSLVFWITSPCESKFKDLVRSQNRFRWIFMLFPWSLIPHANEKAKILLTVGLRCLLFTVMENTTYFVFFFQKMYFSIEL